MSLIIIRIKIVFINFLLGIHFVKLVSRSPNSKVSLNMILVADAEKKSIEEIKNKNTHGIWLSYTYHKKKLTVACKNH